MPDLPPLNDDDELPFEADDEKPKRRLILEDGELPFEVDVEKPKKRPPSRLWRKTYIPIPLLLAISGLLICSAVLLLSTSLVNGSLLCKITNVCAGESAHPILTPTLSHDPRPPSGESRIMHNTVVNSQTNTTISSETTVTPARYDMGRCDPLADYQNHLMLTMGEGDNAEIFLTDTTGDQLCRLTENRIEEKMVDWSLDRKRILFTSQRSGDFFTDIYTMNFDGSNVVNLTQDQADDYHGVWSPDGTQIAFASNRSGSSHIFIMNADGSAVRDLTPSGLNAQTPSWSPDGMQIAYMAGSDNDVNKFEIYTVDVNSGSIRRLTLDAATEYTPVWSPAGSTLLLYADTLSELGGYRGTDLYRLKLQDNSMQRMTFRSDAVSPNWSPDGQQAAFVSNYILNILDLHTGKVRSISSTRNVQGRPVWR